MEKIKNLEKELKKLYTEKSIKVPFHGWHHVQFVRRKAGELAKEIGANDFIVESAALVHDLNRLVDPNSEVESGKELGEKMLHSAGYSDEEIQKIWETVRGTEHNKQKGSLTLEQQALSDGDVLFQSLPVTPILFSSLYLQQNTQSIDEWAKRTLERVKRMIETDEYFYTETAKKKYMEYAKRDVLALEQLNECLTDPDVQEMLELAREMGILK